MRAMAICPNCQSANPEHARFCASCGTRVSTAPEAAGHSAIGGMATPFGEPLAQADDLNRRAMLARARDEVPDALDLVNRALLADPNYVPAIRTRIDILRRIGLTTQAETEALKIQQLEMGGVGYAGFWQRFGAVLLDGIFTLLLTILPGIVVGGVLYLIVIPENPTDTEKDDALQIAVYGWYAVSAVVGFLYYWIGNARGGTWGKRVVGIRVVSIHDGKPIGLGRSFLRYLISLLGSGALYLGWLWMIWDKKKQTWHDKAAGSIVVRR